MRSDNNQQEIVKALRAIGVSVAITNQVGCGFPDLVCGYRGKNYLIEIKNKETYGKLNTEQLIFRDKWNGKIAVVTSVDEAYEIIGAL